MFGKVVGGIMGTVAFSVACIVGLVAGNDITTVLSRGLMAMVIFFVIGFVIGMMGRRLIDEHMNRIVSVDRDKQLARMAEQNGDREAADAEQEPRNQDVPAA